MYRKKLILVLALCAGVMILIYLCRMLAPLLDDVWKILAVGAIAGAALGFYAGIKWKETELDIKKELAARREHSE